MITDSPHRVRVRRIDVAKKLLWRHAERRGRVRGRERGSRATGHWLVRSRGGLYGLPEPSTGCAVVATWRAKQAASRYYVHALVTRSPECSEQLMRLLLRLDRGATESHETPPFTFILFSYSEGSTFFFL